MLVLELDRLESLARFWGSPSGELSRLHKTGALCTALPGDRVPCVSGDFRRPRVGKADFRFGAREGRVFSCWGWGCFGEAGGGWERGVISRFVLPPNVSPHRNCSPNFEKITTIKKRQFFQYFC